MALLKQTTARNRAFLLVQSADHITGLSGASSASIVVQGSKNAGAFTTLTAIVSELGNGYYNAALKTSDTSVLGDLAFHITVASADPTDFIDEVIAFDPQDAVRLGLTALPNVASGSAGSIPTTGTGANQISVAAGLVSLNSSQTVQVGTNNDKSGYSLSQSFPSNFAALSISAAGLVALNSSQTVQTGSNLDKSGYSLSQAFPANFASLLINPTGYVTASSSSSVLVSGLGAFPANFSSLAITGGGAVTVGTNNDKTGYSLTQSFPANFAALGILAGGQVGIDWGNVANKTGTVALTGTTINSSQSVVTGAPVTVGTNNDKTGYALTAGEENAIALAAWTNTQTESYAALHGNPTPLQMLYEMRSMLGEKAVSSTSVTLFKIDGATAAEGFTLDTTSPSQIHRSA